MQKGGSSGAFGVVGICGFYIQGVPPERFRLTMPLQRSLLFIEKHPQKNVAPEEPPVYRKCVYIGNHGSRGASCL
jgi:hypothetical protein